MSEHKCDENVDYRNMYYHMAGALEDAIQILIAAQRTCEDMLLMDLPEAEEEGQPLSGTSK